MFTMPQVSKAVFIPGAPSIFRDFELNTTEGVLAGAAVAVVLAVIVSFPLMRLSGIGASIGTLALLMITYTFFNSWTPGPSGGGNLTMIPEDMTVGKLLVWSVVILVVVYLYQRSRFGLRARASGEDEVAARAVGINIGRERRIAFVLSAGIFGAAGGLYGHYLGSFSAGDFYLSLTFVSLAMLVFGGSRSLFGAVLGSGLLSALSYVVTQWENGSSAFGITLSVPTGTSDLTFAVVLILVLLFLPDGLTKGRELPFPHFALHGGWPLGGARRRIGEGGPPAGLVAQAGVVASVAGSVDHGVHGSPTGDEE
jgi:branched-chain amino acid transport system permease protein